MARSPYFLAILVLTIASCNPRTIEETKKKTIQLEDFLVKCDVLYAIEDGPLALRATLCYRGKETVRLHKNLQLDNVSANVPAKWKFHIQRRIYCGRFSGSIEMKPGDQWSEVLYLHEGYQPIPPGTAELTLSWILRESVEPYRLIGYPSTTLVVSVPPATPKNLARLRECLQDMLHRSNLSNQDWKELIATVRNTKHRALYPVIMGIIEHPEAVNESAGLLYSVTTMTHLISLAHDLSEVPDETQARFVKLATNKTWGHARSVSDLFDYWRSKQHALSACDFRKLADCDNLWTRILLYVTFPNQCDRAWTETLLHEVRSRVRSLPSHHFEQLLRELDDSEFLVRERASARLEELGECVKLQLNQAQRTNLSPEAKRRVRFTLDAINSAPWTADCDYVIRSLSEWRQTSEGDAILLAFAEGDPNLRLTKYVQKALKERQNASSSRR